MQNPELTQIGTEKRASKRSLDQDDTRETHGGVPKRQKRGRYVSQAWFVSSISCGTGIEILILRPKLPLVQRRMQETKVKVKIDYTGNKAQPLILVSV